jgi:hypothetical protein
MFPQHYHLFIAHNDHKVFHIDLKSFILELEMEDNFKNNSEMHDSILSDEIWTFTIYDSPEIIYNISASSFERCIEIWKEQTKKDQSC